MSTHLVDGPNVVGTITYHNLKGEMGNARKFLRLRKMSVES